MAVTIEDFIGNFQFNVPKGDSKSLEAVSGFVDNIFLGLGKLIGITAGVYGIASAISDFVDDAIQLKNVSQITNTGVDDLYNWANAMNAAGQKGSAGLETMQRVASDLMGLRTGEGSDLAGFFQSIGIQVQNADGSLRPMTDIFTDLSGKVMEFAHDPAMQRKIFDSLGIDDKTARFLMQGPEKIRELQENMARIYTMTDEHADTAERVGFGWERIKTYWGLASDRLTSALMPAVEKFLGYLEDFTLWLVTDEERFNYFVAALVGIFTYTLLPILSLVGAGFLLIAAKVAILMGFFALIGMAVQYVINDFRAWRSGGESAFGEFWDVVGPMLLHFWDRLEALGKFLVRFWNDPKKGWEEAKQWWAGISLYDEFWNIGVSAGKAIMAAWDHIIMPAIRAWWPEIKAELYSIWEFLYTEFGNAQSKINKALSGIDFSTIGSDIGTAIYQGILDAINALFGGKSEIKWDSLWGGMKEQLDADIESIKLIFFGLLNFVSGLLSSLFEKSFKYIGDALEKQNKWFTNKVSGLLRGALGDTISDLLGISAVDASVAQATPADAARPGSAMMGGAQTVTNNTEVTATISVGDASGNTLEMLEQRFAAAIKSATAQGTAYNLRRGTNNDGATSNG